MFACLCGTAHLQAEVRVVRPKVVTVRKPVVEGRDITFHRFPATAGLSQTRVSQIAQDDDGFMWFGTQSGLNRFDGYKCKVFKHDPRQPGSLSGVFLYSVFKDSSGKLWASSDQYLDQFDPVMERFHRFHFSASQGQKAVNFGNIYQDRSGTLWLGTSDGLYGLDPATGRSFHYQHDPKDPASLNQTDLQSLGEDRSGRLWIGMWGGLDHFDSRSGKVTERMEFDNTGLAVWLHEDRFQSVWIRDGNGNVGILDRENNVLTRFVWQPPEGARNSNDILTMLEDRDGTMWFGTSNQGLLRYDREHDRFIRYTMRPGDEESLPDNRIIVLFQDREGNIWAGTHQTAPVFFSPKPPMFEKFTYQPGNPNSLGSTLVSVIHEDRDGTLWLGADRLIKRLDRTSGKYSVFPHVTGHEVLSIFEQGPEVLWMGTGGLGLKRYDRITGNIRTFLSSGKPTDLCTDFVEKLMMDREGRLWAAAWGGLCYLDPATERFTSFREMSAHRTYHAIAEDRDGMIWIGSNLGLQRLNPASGSVTAFEHSDDPGSVSDNRINSIYPARDGTLWIGTQNGLDRFDARANRFVHFNEKDGMAGSVVACVLEDRGHRLWMSTNAGISSFDPEQRQFRNYSVADGLPGPDLTGWGACFQSTSGEMFFGGFSGAAAFYPDRITEVSDAPPVVLTGFRLFGSPVGIGEGSPLTKSITRPQSIRLTHAQDIFSIEFSALSYGNPGTNRYRYRLEGLQPEWVQASSDQRQASYTTLAAGSYTFRVQGATSRGAWSEPGVALHIQILPPWWNALWFRATYVTLLALILWGGHRYRLHQIAERYNLRVEERVNERTRIARDLHDTLLQSFQAVLWKFSTVKYVMRDNPGEAEETLEGIIEQARAAITEGRDAVQGLRSSTVAARDLARAVTTFGEGLAADQTGPNRPEFCVLEEGKTRDLPPLVRDEVYQIACEAVRNAFRHAHPQRIKVEFRYETRQFRLRVVDNGKGIDPAILRAGARAGHHGLPGINERAGVAGGKLSVWSQVDTGTEIELTIPATIAYTKSVSGPRPMSSGKGAG